jgi:hypothetical protein
VQDNEGAVRRSRQRGRFEGAVAALALIAVAAALVGLRPKPRSGIQADEKQADARVADAESIDDGLEFEIPVIQAIDGEATMPFAVIESVKDVVVHKYIPAVRACYREKGAGGKQETLRMFLVKADGAVIAGGLKEEDPCTLPALRGLQFPPLPFSVRVQVALRFRS